MRKRFSKQSDKSPYVIFNPHTTKPCTPYQDGSIVTTCIDPAILNCAFRTAVYDINTRKSRTLFMLKFDFTESSSKFSTLGHYGMETRYYSTIYETLAPYEEYFLASQYICIESQMSFNYQMTRMGQHLISYMMQTVRNKGAKPLIIEICSKTKSQMLNAPPKLNSAQLKLWAHEMGIKYLEADGEIERANFLRSLPKTGKNKGNDYGDVICYEKCLLLLLSQGICKIPTPGN
jgi:hypothetical protein